MSFDGAVVRHQFPALQQVDEAGRSYAFFDGPGGTQVPHTVMEAISSYLMMANANLGGPFETSRRSEEVVSEARRAMADFLNAPMAEEIIFGANMTTLTFQMSRAIGKQLNPGDEIIVTRLDHDANISPWLALEEQGMVIKWVDFAVEDCRLDMAQFESLLSEKTKLVAVGYASNAVGTINPISQITQLAHQVGAWVWVDAVHYAPHGPLDVQALDCDFLVCSAYKFFGPHVGVLWGKMALLQQLPAYKVRPASNQPPGKFETGTQNFEGIHGVTAAVDYLASVGRVYNLENRDIEERREQLVQGMQAIAAYERTLFAELLRGLQAIPGVQIYGITKAAAFAERCPTVAFTMAHATPEQIARHLGEQSIFVWHGHYYAVSVMERLGLNDSGGAVRVGLAHYNTTSEVARLLTALQEL